jgi:hypothetical protein
MAVVRVVEVIPHQEVDVFPVRDGFVAAPVTVGVVRVVRAARVLRRAARGVGRVDRERVLVDVISVWMMKMAGVQVVGVAVMEECDVTAPRPVFVVVCGVGSMVHATSISQDSPLTNSMKARPVLSRTDDPVCSYSYAA